MAHCPGSRRAVKDGLHVSVSFWSDFIHASNFHISKMTTLETGKLFSQFVSAQISLPSGNMGVLCLAIQWALLVERQPPHPLHVHTSTLQTSSCLLQDHKFPSSWDSSVHRSLRLHTICHSLRPKPCGFVWYSWRQHKPIYSWRDRSTLQSEGKRIRRNLHKHTVYCLLLPHPIDIVWITYSPPVSICLCGCWSIQPVEGVSKDTFYTYVTSLKLAYLNEHFFNL